MDKSAINYRVVLSVEEWDEGGDCSEVVEEKIVSTHTHHEKAKADLDLAFECLGHEGFVDE